MSTAAYRTGGMAAPRPAPNARLQAYIAAKKESDAAARAEARRLELEAKPAYLSR